MKALKLFGVCLTLTLILSAAASNRGIPYFRSNGLIVRLNDNEVTVWYWVIRYPHNFNFVCFPLSYLNGLRLREDYLKLELYVIRIYPWGGIWWPLRCSGPRAFGKSLKGVMELGRGSEGPFINITYLPKGVKGVTITYEAELPKFNASGLTSLTLPLGPFGKQVIYLQLSSDLKFLKATLSKGSLKLREIGEGPPFAPLGYKYHILEAFTNVTTPLSITLTKA